MQSFFYYFGVFAFVILAGLLMYVVYSSTKYRFSEMLKKYNDYCYLANLGWTDKEYLIWMKTTRQQMSDVEYKKWYKDNVRFWYTWVCFKKIPTENSPK